MSTSVGVKRVKARPDVADGAVTVHTTGSTMSISEVEQLVAAAAAVVEDAALPPLPPRALFTLGNKQDRVLNVDAVIEVMLTIR